MKDLKRKLIKRIKEGINGCCNIIIYIPFKKYSCRSCPFISFVWITIQRPEHYLDPSKIAKKDFYTSDTPPSEKRDEIPIQNDYSVYVQLNGHSG